MTAFLGCLLYGFLMSRRGRQGWRIRRQYLCQSAVLVSGLSLLSLTTLEVEYTVLYNYSTVTVPECCTCLRAFFSCTFTLEVEYSVQYLCQSAVLVSGLSLLSLTTLEVEYSVQYLCQSAVLVSGLSL
jgi:hypothetical protein